MSWCGATGMDARRRVPTPRHIHFLETYAHYPQTKDPGGSELAREGARSADACSEWKIDSRMNSLLQRIAKSVLSVALLFPAEISHATAPERRNRREAGAGRHRTMVSPLCHNKGGRPSGRNRIKPHRKHPYRDPIQNGPETYPARKFPASGFVPLSPHTNKRNRHGSAARPVNAVR